jgi:hypothetical protein
MLVGIAASEIATGVSVGIFRHPRLGLMFLAAGIAIGLRWARRRRQCSDTLVGAQIDEADRLRLVGSYCEAWNLGCDAAQRASHPTLMNSALTILTHVALDERRFQTARDLVSRMKPRDQVDPCLKATIERADGRTDLAIEILEEARLGPGLERNAARLLVELRAESDDLEWAVFVAVQWLDVIGHDDIRLMIASLESWGERRHASALAEALARRSQPAMASPSPPAAVSPGSTSITPTHTRVSS